MTFLNNVFSNLFSLKCNSDTFNVKSNGKVYRDVKNRYVGHELRRVSQILWKILRRRIQSFFGFVLLLGKSWKERRSTGAPEAVVFRSLIESEILQRYRVNFTPILTRRPSVQFRLLQS